jgi:hypothetical protein
LLSLLPALAVEDKDGDNDDSGTPTSGLKMGPVDENE